MRKIIYILLISLATSCNKKDIGAPADPCSIAPVQVYFTKTESIGSSNNGTISITEPRGDTISYQLNNGAFGSSWYFTNLSPGDYVVTARNTRGCSDSVHIKILNYGPRYAAVKQIILGYCGPCHLNGAVNGGKNFDTDASIVSSKDRIKVRTVDGIPSFMPEGSQLTSVDKQKIVDWINAGGTTLN